MHEKKKAGSTPNVATSLALMFMASHPIRSIAPVIGSIETTAFLVPISRIAPSTPVLGPKITSLRAAPKFLKTTSFRMSMGIFPGGNFMLIPLLEVAFKLWENPLHSNHDWHSDN